MLAKNSSDKLHDECYIQFYKLVRANYKHDLHCYYDNKYRPRASRQWRKMLWHCHYTLLTNFSWTNDP